MLHAAIIAAIIVVCFVPLVVSVLGSRPKRRLWDVAAQMAAKPTVAVPKRRVARDSVLATSSPSLEAIADVAR